MGISTQAEACCAAPAHLTRMVALVSAVLLAACGGHRSTPPGGTTPTVTVQASASARTSVPAVDRSSPARAVSAPARSMTAAPNAPVVQPDARAVALAYVHEICPYSWRAPARYGDTFNAALQQYATADYVAAHRYTSSRTAAVAAGMTTGHEVQTCAGYAVYRVKQAQPVAAITLLRVAATITVTADGVPANSAAQFYGLQLTDTGAGWKISADVTGG
jgi:hypothetical protein